MHPVGTRREREGLGRRAFVGGRVADGPCRPGRTRAKGGRAEPALSPCKEQSAPGRFCARDRHPHGPKPRAGSVSRAAVKWKRASRARCGERRTRPAGVQYCAVAELCRIRWPGSGR